VLGSGCLLVSPSQTHDVWISVANMTAGISPGIAERSSNSMGSCSNTHNTNIVYVAVIVRVAITVNNTNQHTLVLSVCLSFTPIMTDTVTCCTETHDDDDSEQHVHQQNYCHLTCQTHNISLLVITMYFTNTIHKHETDIISKFVNV